MYQVALLSRIGCHTVQEANRPEVTAFCRQPGTWDVPVSDDQIEAACEQARSGRPALITVNQDPLIRVEVRYLGQLAMQQDYEYAVMVDRYLESFQRLHPNRPAYPVEQGAKNAYEQAAALWVKRLDAMPPYRRAGYDRRSR